MEKLLQGRVMRKIMMEPKYENWFLRDFAKASHRILLLDYDGTLAPRSPHPKSAFPYTGIRERLRRISGEPLTRLITVSGRPAYEVKALLGIDPGPEIWGSDGIERVYPNGRYECDELDVPLSSLKALESCEAALRSKGLEKIMATSLRGILVRCNGLTEAEAFDSRTKAYEVFEPVAAAHEKLRLVETEEGVELRLRCANKGNAVKRLLAGLPQDVSIACLGDDLSDEDAFRVLNGRGLTILVSPVARFTAAQINLRPPDEVITFLDDWIRASRF
jgi:trehalose-phosphatase